MVDFYAQANRIPVADASRILTDFLSEMKEVLKVKKTIVFPGLGRLRATRENHFFFVADEVLACSPSPSKPTKKPKRKLKKPSLPLPPSWNKSRSRKISRLRLRLRLRSKWQ